MGTGEKWNQKVATCSHSNTPAQSCSRSDHQAAGILRQRSRREGAQHAQQNGWVGVQWHRWTCETSMECDTLMCLDVFSLDLLGGEPWWSHFLPFFGMRLCSWQEAKERFTCQICFEEWRLENGAAWRCFMPPSSQGDEHPQPAAEAIWLWINTY